MRSCEHLEDFLKRGRGLPAVAGKNHQRRMDRLRPSAIGRGLFPGRIVAWTCWRRQAAGATHRGPVIFIGRSTDKAYLVILTTNARVRPREAMLAKTFQKSA
ncbi:MAG TPA: hypothetical protein VGU64_11450 [Terriglobales bacterium]|nr:hypothetical protein [Terriglobales bacterium]